MTEHLGHDKHAAVSNSTGNARNGKSHKFLKGEFGELPIKIPRDRESRLSRLSRNSSSSTKRFGLVLMARLSRSALAV